MIAQATANGGAAKRGDINPYNVLVSSDDLSLVLLDFSGTVSARAGQAAPPLFSPGFSAPEQLRSDIGTYNDVYSLGGMALYLNRAETPPTYEEMCYRNPDLSLTGRVYYRLAAVVKQMLALEPAERYQTAMDVIEAIRRHGTTEVYDSTPRGTLLLPDGGRVDMAYHRYDWMKKDG